ncbi:amidohydrolase [Echinicola sp. 20G]|uniref:amidohydrolase n=1 Tax=Echinicola sp. 20G TaxID=2781961 RepID=UPI001910FE5B|nr:amidohydrolase [Echinicola sp. 20G]
MKKSDLQILTKFRKALHQYPELSHQEKETAHFIVDFFEPLNPSEIIEKLGGYGLAIVFRGKEKGPRTLFRCELDALPIHEELNTNHKSKLEGKSHTCGHDGHMAIIAGLGLGLADKPLEKGEVVLLFQPAEETGEGAEKVIKDKNFAKIKPDFAFALHNLPGYPKHEIVLKKGPFAAASKGMIITLKGKTSHAAHPEDGNSPTEALAKLMVGLQVIPQSLSPFSLITVIQAELGEIAFGTSPGKAIVRATLRSYDDETMSLLTTNAEQLSQLIAKEYKLQCHIDYTESFASTVNDETAWEYVNEAAKSLKLKTKHIRNPFRWSEDFGHFSAHTSTMLFGLGAGKSQPQLHEPTYDFPDDIIPTGIKMFETIIQQIHQ